MNYGENMKITDKSFFEMPADKLAPALLGKVLCTQKGSFIITETECYKGAEDSACHARTGKTARNSALWDAGGRVYVYLCYGIHWLFNIVAGVEDSPQGVLIRGVTPVPGASAPLVNPAESAEPLLVTNTNAALPTGSPGGHISPYDTGLPTSLSKINNGCSGQGLAPNQSLAPGSLPGGREPRWSGSPPLPISLSKINNGSNVTLVGPGRVTKAAGIDGSFAQENIITSSRVRVEERGINAVFKTAKRVGIDYATPEYRDILWRFVLDK